MRRLAGMIGLVTVGASLAAADPIPERVPWPCEVIHPSDARVDWDCRLLGPGETLESRFGERWADIARFNRIDRRHATPGVRLKVPARLDDIQGFTPMPAVYEPAEGDARFVLVDLSEQFLGAYEYGRLAFSAPVVTGRPGYETPAGDFRITAAHRAHVSSLYVVEGTTVPYPMRFALRFHVTAAGVAFWLHGRDLPGYPASHGCVGLYDEEMQARQYGAPSTPVLDDARLLYDWVTGPRRDEGGLLALPDGPRIQIVGQAPGRV